MKKVFASLDTDGGGTVTYEEMSVRENNDIFGDFGIDIDNNRCEVSRGFLEQKSAKIIFPGSPRERSVDSAATAVV